MARAISKIQKIVEKDVGQLKLDSHNVRFKYLKKTLSEKEIEEEIWKEDATNDLYTSVLTTGGVEEPLIIDSNDVVVEGNRRLVVLRKLRDKAHKKELGDVPEHQFDSVRCLQLPSDAKPVEIDVLRLTLHVSGRKEWDAINKAAHIYDMHERYNMSYDKIRDYVGGTKATLINYVKAFKATKEYLEKHPSDKVGIHRFSYFYDLQRKPALRQWLSDDPFAMDTFMKWLASGKFRDHKQIRKLPDVLRNNEALTALNSKNMDVALKVLTQYDPTLGSTTFKLVYDTIEALRSMPRNELLALPKKPSQQKLLQDLHDEVEDILKNL